MVSYQRFMFAAKLKKCVFSASPENDHEHCIMCWDKFSEKSGDLHEGYVTLDNQCWVCPECMRQYAKEYRWIVEN